MTFPETCSQTAFRRHLRGVFVDPLVGSIWE